MMQLIYNRKRNRKDTYTYKLNSGGVIDFRHSGTGTIEIVFVNGKFDHAETGGNSFFDERNKWRAYAAIEEEIQRLEKVYANGDG